LEDTWEAQAPNSYVLELLFASYDMIKQFKSLQTHSAQAKCVNIRVSTKNNP
jgi:hypothetical protein